MTLQSRLTALASAIGGDIKALGTRVGLLEQALVFSARCGNNNNPVAGEYDWTGLGMSVELVDVNNGHAAGSSQWTVVRNGKFGVVSRGCWQINNNGRRGVGVQHWRSGALLGVYATSVVNATANDPTVHGAFEAVTLQGGDNLIMVGKQQGSGAIVSHLRDGTYSGTGFDVIYLGP